MFRQGDLKIRRVESLPKGVTKMKTKTLAYGEVTGHHHTLIPMGDTKVQLHRMLDKMYFEVTNGSAMLVHTAAKKIDSKSIDEFVKKMVTKIRDGEDYHIPQKFEEGVYEVEIEKEYNPFIEELSNVTD